MVWRRHLITSMLSFRASAHKKPCPMRKIAASILKTPSLTWTKPLQAGMTKKSRPIWQRKTTFSIQQSGSATTWLLPPATAWTLSWMDMSGVSVKVRCSTLGVMSLKLGSNLFWATLSHSKSYMTRLRPQVTSKTLESPSTGMEDSQHFSSTSIRLKMRLLMASTRTATILFLRS